MNKIMYAIVGMILIVGSFGVVNVALAADLYDYNADYWYAEPEPVYDLYNADYWYAEPDYNADYWYAEPSYNADYWYAQPSFDYGCGSLCYSSYTPSYSSGSGCFSCGGGYSPPRYTPTVSVGQPARSSSSSYYNSNTVSNTNVNNVTNIDNSINDSFNNYNSNNTSLVVATPQYPVVYTSPAPSCTITHALTGNYGYYTSGTVAYLSWTSQNATSAYLSNVGSVSTSGSQNVYPGYTTTYTLTVYGANGQTANCQTTVNVNTYIPPTYNPPVQQPYVALTQIPYTGFDFGPVGNALYWAALLSFAVAGAYLMIYYRGGMFAFAGSAVRNTRTTPKTSNWRATMPSLKVPSLYSLPLFAHLQGAEEEAPVVEQPEAPASVQPVVASIRKAGTADAMAIVQSKDGSMPKIVIERH